MIGGFLKKLFQNYCRGVIRIIENKKKIDISIHAQKALIAISFIQVSGYIVTLAVSNNLVEAKISSFTTMMEISSGTFLLYLVAIDTFTWIACVFMNIFLLSCFIFSLFIGSLSQNSKLLNSQIVQYIASFYNAFLIAYNWVFIISFIEINVGIIVCGEQNYLVSFRGSCTTKPWYQMALALFGLALTFLTSFCVIYFFRNYEFHERMKLKRRFDFIQIPIISCKIVMVILYYYLPGKAYELSQGYIQNVQSNDILQFSFSLSFIGFSIYDIIENLPFLHDDISRFYIYCLSLNTGMTLNFGFWQILLILKQDELFYSFCIMSVLCYTLLMGLYQCKYQVLLKNMVITTSKKSLTDFSGQSVKSYAENFDFFIEEFVQLCENSSLDEEKKFKVFEFIRQHTEICEYVNCYCKEEYFSRFISLDKNDFSSSSIFKGKKKQNNQDLDLNELIKLAESIFKIFISSSQQVSTSVREHLQLKYISFVTKHLNNPKKSYFELKFLLNEASKKSKDLHNTLNSSSASFYFLLIEGIVSLFILQKVRNQLDEVKFQNKQFQKADITGVVGANHSHGQITLNANFSIRLEAKIINSIDNATNKILPKILEVVKTKSVFWRKFTEEGFKELRDMRNLLLQTAKQLKKKQIEINNELNKLQNGIVWIQSINFLRLMQLIDIVLHNDIHQAQMRQKLILDIQNREQSKEGEMQEEKNEQHLGAVQSNKKQLNNELVCIVSSVSNNNQGYLVSKNESISKFFGFTTRQESSVLNNIKQLMPEFIAKHHDQFVQKYLEYEDTYSGFSKFQINRANLRPGSLAIQGKLYTFAKNRLGFIFPISIQIDLPLLINSNDFIFATSIQKLPNTYEYILFNKQGNILGISEKILNLLFREAKSVPSVVQVQQQLNVHSIFYNLLKILKENREIINHFIEKPIDTFFNKKDLSDSDTLGEMVIEGNKRSSIELSSDPIGLNRQLENYLRKQILLKKTVLQQGISSSKKGTTDQNADSSCMDSQQEKYSMSFRSNNKKGNKSTNSYNLSQSKYSEIQYDFLDENFQASLTEFFYQKRVQSYHSIKTKNFQNSIKLDNSMSKGVSGNSLVSRGASQDQKFLRFQYTLYQCSFPIYLNQLTSKTNNTTSQEFKDTIYFKLAIKDITVNSKAEQDQQLGTSQNTFSKSINTQNYKNGLSVEYSKTGLESYKTVKSFGNKSKGVDKLGKKTETTLLDSQHSKYTTNSENEFGSIQRILKTPPVQPSPRNNFSKASPKRDIVSNKSRYRSSVGGGKETNENMILLKMGSSISPKQSLKIIQEEQQVEIQQSNLFPTESEPKTFSENSKQNFDNARQSLMLAIHNDANPQQQQQQYRSDKYLSISPSKKPSSSFLNQEKLTKSEIENEALQSHQISQQDFLGNTYFKKRGSTLSSMPNALQEQNQKKSILEVTKPGSNQRIPSSMQNVIRQVDSDDLVVRGSHLAEKIASSGEDQIHSSPSALKNDSNNTNNQSSNEKENKQVKSQIISEEGDSIIKQISQREQNNEEPISEHCDDEEKEEEQRDGDESEKDKDNECDNDDDNYDDNNEGGKDDDENEKIKGDNESNKRGNMKKIIRTMKKFGKKNSMKDTQTQKVVKLNESSVSSRQTLNSNAGLAYMKELVSQTKMPRSINQYVSMLNLFFILFIVAVFISLSVVTDDIVSIEDQLFVLRLPRQFNENYNKQLYAYYLDLQLGMGMIDKDLIGFPINTLISNYTGAAFKAEDTLLTDNQNFILSFTQVMQTKKEIEQYQDIVFYSSEQEKVLQINSALIIHMTHMQMFLIQKNQNEIKRRDSFLFFRRNIMKNTQFLKQIVDSSKEEALYVINSLTEKVIYVAVVCVLTVVFIALAILPIMRQNKKYETMILSTFCTLKLYQGLTEEERLEYFADQYQPICNSLKNLDDFSNSLIFCYQNTSFSTRYNFGQRASLLNRDKSKGNKNNLMSFVKQMQSQIQKQNVEMNKSIKKSQNLEMNKSNDISKSKIEITLTHATHGDMNKSNIELNKSQKIIAEVDETKEISSHMMMSRMNSNNLLMQSNSINITQLQYKNGNSTNDEILVHSINEKDNKLDKQLNSNLSFGQLPQEQKETTQNEEKKGKSIPKQSNKAHSVNKQQKDNKAHQSDIIKQNRMDQSMQRQVENFELTIFSSLKSLACMIILSCIFFFVICIIVAKQNSDMVNPINVNYAAISLHFLSANMLVYSNLLAFDKYLKANTPQYNLIYDLSDHDQMEKVLDQYIDDIPQYQSDLINKVINLNIYTQAQRDSLLSLLQGDICDLVNSLGTVLTAASTCGDPKKLQFFQKGTLGGIEQMRTLILQYQETIFKVDVPSKEDIYNFVNNSLHIEYFIKGYDLLIKVISNLSTRINSTNIILVNDFANFVKDYFYIFGIILIFLFLFMIIYSIHTLKGEIFHLQSSLQLIPQDYFSDERILHILKKLCSL